MAYPPPDIEIGNYLGWRATNCCDAQTRYLHLLGHIFKTVSEELHVLCPQRQPSYTALAEAWCKYMETGQNRSRIYGAAVKKCSANDLVHTLFMICVPHSFSRQGDLHKRYPAPAGVLNPLHAVSQEAERGLSLLLQTIDDSCKSMEGIKSNHVKLMLYFDEAHVLWEKQVPNASDGKNFYDVLCWCFNVFVSSPIFAIFLSTSSHISKLAPQGSLSPSARVYQNLDALQTPITETPFDCSPKLPIKPGLKLKDLYQTEFMAQFGRPL
jgi:hypothetical protein